MVAAVANGNISESCDVSIRRFQVALALTDVNVARFHR